MACRRSPPPRAARAALLLGLAASAACLRFKAPLLEEPAAVLERFVLCSAVEPKDGWAEPGPDRTVFRREEGGRAFAFVAFAALRGAHTLGWKWYGPDGRAARAPDPIPVGEAGKAFESYIAWDAIALGPEGGTGVWTAAVFLDGALLVSRTFEIR